MIELNNLREKLRRIDEDILKFIKRRLVIAEKIGEIKKRDGIPLKNWELEKKIIDNTKIKAKSMGISEETSVEIMQKIIGESCLVQEISHFLKYNGEKENIFIIGGNGKMGKWFADFFRSQGHNVLLYDIRTNRENNNFVDFEKGLENSSITVIATPMKTIPAVIEKIIEFGYSGVVFDISSVKCFLTNTYKKALKSGIAATSIHPLFGPNARILSDKILYHCDLGNKKANEKIELLFSNTALNMVRTSFEDHDKIISYVLNLSHLINIIYSEILSNSGLTYKTLSSFGSTTFFSQIKTMKSVMSEDPKLYFDIQTLSSHNNSLFQEFEKAADRIMKSVKNGVEEDFKNIMLRGRKWMEE